MARTIQISIPHDLTQAEARSRIERGLADFRKSHAARISEVNEQWTENHLDFHLRAVGQQISGRLDVLPHEIQLAIDLPWMLALLAGKLTNQVEQEGRRMLEKK